MSENSKQPDPFKRLLKNVKTSANYGPKGGSVDYEYEEKVVEFDDEDLREIFHRQGGRCYWSDVELEPTDIFVTYHPLAMSVDRIDNTKGYTLDNIVISSRLYNLGRSAAPPELWESVLDRLDLYGRIR